MTHVIVAGDGPGGLSAALFLAKNGVDVTVVGKDETAMHYAELHNYLGIPKILGSDFQVIARQQVDGFGAAYIESHVTSVSSGADGFAVALENGDELKADYVILAEGRGRTIAKALGLPGDESGVEVTRNGQTAISNLYAIGRMTRVNGSQAIISAGEGAAAALDILAQLAGKIVNDWDSPPKD